MSKDTVTKDRNSFIGGSDFGSVLNLSPYKTRYELLLEKLGIKEPTNLDGNKYIEFGNTLEPLVRNHLIKIWKADIKEDVLVLEDLKVRANIDGLITGGDSSINRLIEIKTATDVEKALNNKNYLAQLLFYMHYYNIHLGYLAVYENDNFNTNFDKAKLHIKAFMINELEEILKVNVENEVINFWNDFQTLKAYHDLGMELGEDMITNNEVTLATNKVIQLENQLAEMKSIEAQLKEAKQKLLNVMLDTGVKKWEMPNGTKITLVAESTSTKKVLLENKVQLFLNEHNENIEKYYTDKVSKRSAFVKITIPKKESEIK